MALGGKGMAGIVVGDVPGTALLIGAQHQFGVFAQGQPQLLDTAQGHQGSHGGALVIVGAPAIDQVPIPHQG